MAELRVSARYARAVLGLAEQQQQLQQVYQDLQLFYKTLKAHKQLKAVLENPVIKGGAKKQILQKLFTGKVSELTILFFNIMINKGRAALLYDTAAQFFEQYKLHEHIVTARVVSASALTPEQEKAIVEAVQEVKSGTIELETRTDPSLIGGFILKVGDQQYDTSIARKLRTLKHELTTN